MALAESSNPLRGDEGVLTDFEPQAAVWLTPDRVLVSESGLNNLHIFDLEGRRFRKFNAATNKGPAHFTGMAHLGGNEYLVLGSHYHEKNHPRYRDLRSRLHRFRLNVEDEDLILDDLRQNISPLKALRRTRMWGAQPLRQLEFSGISVDKANGLVWFSMVQPLSDKGEITLLRYPLKDLLEGNDDADFTEVNTNLESPIGSRCQKPSYVTDLHALDDGSLLLLLTSDDQDGARLCSNSLWRWMPGRGATQVKADLAPERRATGMAVRSLGSGEYEIALVCDNLTGKTGIPPTLVRFSESLKIH